MHEHRPSPPALDTSVFLRRGNAARKLTLRLVVRAPDDEPSAARRALCVFLRAVDAELFGPAAAGAPPVLASTAHLEEAGDLAVYSLEAAFPRTRPEAFAVLARLVERSVPRAVSLTIREHGPEAALVVRRFEPVETEATLADVPWRVVLPICGSPAVTVELAGEPDWHTLQLALERLEAWTDVVALGGFPGPGTHVFSRAVLRSKGRFAPRTVGLRLDELACAHEGVETLYQALLAVHERTPIESVSVTHGPGQARVEASART